MSYANLRPRPASLAALLLALALPLSGCDDTTGPHDILAEEDFSFSFDATGKVLLTMEARNGTITITGVAGGDQLSVDGVRQVWATSQADADEHLDSVEVTIDENPDNFVITTEHPSSGERTYVVNYDIELPDGMELVITSANGEITVASIQDDIVIASGNGNVILGAIEGSVTVALGNGVIDANVTVPLGGNVELAVGNGEIGLSIPQSTSAEFSAEVGNGSISVENLTLGNQVTTPTMVTGTLGGGQGTIRLGVGNGTISVTGI